MCNLGDREKHSAFTGYWSEENFVQKRTVSDDMLGTDADTFFVLTHVQKLYSEWLPKVIQPKIDSLQHLNIRVAGIMQQFLPPNLYSGQFCSVD